MLSSWYLIEAAIARCVSLKSSASSRPLTQVPPLKYPPVFVLRIMCRTARKQHSGFHPNLLTLNDLFAIGYFNVKAIPYPS
jgi:hypothetical protein